jgi:hypothetical protein
MQNILLVSATFRLLVLLCMFGLIACPLVRYFGLDSLPGMTRARWNTRETWASS